MGRAVRAGVWAFCVATAFVLPVSLLWSYVLKEAGLDPPVQVTVQRILEPDHAHDPYLIAFFASFVAPFNEEAIFRGLLYPTLREVGGGGRRGVWIAAVITSALFAAIHGSLLAAMPLFALAMVLVWVFERTNSLAAVMIAHGLHNATTVLPILLLGGGA